MLKAVVIGARRARQGIGEFVAAALHREGVRVSGVVGTGNATANEAKKTLHEKYEMSCAGYASLSDALRREKPDLVAICSPIHEDDAFIEAALKRAV